MFVEEGVGCGVAEDVPAAAEATSLAAVGLGNEGIDDERVGNTGSSVERGVNVDVVALGPIEEEFSEEVGSESVSGSSCSGSTSSTILPSKSFVCVDSHR